MKSKEQLDQAWQEHITSRNNPTEGEIDKDVLEQLYSEIENYKLPVSYPNTNYKAYKTIAELYNQNKNLEYATIAKIFDIENRSEIDLQNLKEFIIVVTLMSGKDILKAQVRDDKTKEKQEMAKHQTRCELMSVLLQAIDSHLYTLD